MILDLHRQFADLGIEIGLAQFVQIHDGVREEEMVILITQANGVKANVPNGNQALERFTLVVLLGGKSIHEELVVPSTIRQTMDVCHNVLEAHMGEADLVAAQRERTEMGINLPDERKGVALLIFEIDIAESETRGEAVLHPAHIRLRA